MLKIKDTWRKTVSYWDGTLVRSCISNKISSLFPLAHACITAYTVTALMWAKLVKSQRLCLISCQMPVSYCIFPYTHLRLIQFALQNIVNLYHYSQTLITKHVGFNNNNKKTLVFMGILYVQRMLLRHRLLTLILKFNTMTGTYSVYPAYCDAGRACL